MLMPFATIFFHGYFFYKNSVKEIKKLFFKSINGYEIITHNLKIEQAFVLKLNLISCIANPNTSALDFILNMKSEEKGLKEALSFYGFYYVFTRKENRFFYHQLFTSTSN